ncbi:115_t:CDS:2, partial [Cetraspora pellucida]
EVYPNNAQKELLKLWIDSSQTPHRNNKRNEQQTMTIRVQYCHNGWPNKEEKVTLDSWVYGKNFSKNKADCIYITTIDSGFCTFLTWYSPMEIS